MSPGHRLLLIPGLAALLAAAPATAETLFLTGANGAGETRYAYVGGIIPIGKSLGENGWRVRLWADTLQYRYTLGSSKVTADATGVSVGGSYFIGIGSGSSMTLGVGALNRNTRISPADPANAQSGNQTKGQFEMQGDFEVSGAVRVQPIASYIPGWRAYWTRLRVPVRIGQSITLGPEVVAHGSPVYRAGQFGLTLGNIAFTNSAFFNVSGGMSHVEKDKSRPYLNLELAVFF